MSTHHDALADEKQAAFETLTQRYRHLDDSALLALHPLLQQQIDMYKTALGTLSPTSSSRDSYHQSYHQAFVRLVLLEQLQRWITDTELPQRGLLPQTLGQPLLPTEHPNPVDQPTHTSDTELP